MFDSWPPLFILLSAIYWDKILESSIRLVEKRTDHVVFCPAISWSNTKISGFVHVCTRLFQSFYLCWFFCLYDYTEWSTEWSIYEALGRTLGGAHLEHWMKHWVKHSMEHIWSVYGAYMEWWIEYTWNICGVTGWSIEWSIHGILNERFTVWGKYWYWINILGIST